VKRIFLFLCLSFTVSVFAGETLTIEKSIEIAISNNLQVKAVEEKIKQADYSKKEAYTYLLPRLSSTFTYTRLNEAGVIDFSGTSSPVTDADLYNLGFALSQPLYTGGRLSALYEQAKENLKETGFEKDTVIQNLILDVKKGYFSILKAKKSVQTVNSLKEMAEEHLKTAKSLFEEGVVTKMDVLKTEVFLADAEQQILQAENALALARSGFSFLLNLPLSSDIDVEDVPERERRRNTIEYWTALACEQRPELKELESVARIYGYNIEVEKSGYRPQVALFANYLWDRGTQNAVGEWVDSWNLGIALELDIWNWGETGYRVQKASHQKEEIEKQYALLHRSIELEVKDSYLNLETSGKQIVSSKKSLEKAEENLRVTRILYKEGMATTTDVLDAQSGLATARNSYYQAQYDYHIAYAELKKSSGMVTKK